MSFPKVRNETGFAFECLHVTDERGMPVFVPLVQATYSIAASAVPELLKEQPPISLAGEWYGDPAVTSIRMEPQSAFIKLATDVVLLGHAFPKVPGATEGQVGIRIGSMQKVVRVIGDRWIAIRDGHASITAPQPFEKIPLLYERSFGGWDRRGSDTSRHRFEPRNPVGTGFFETSLTGDAQARLPNFEDPARPYRGYGDNPPPAGFGFIGPDWLPRAPLAGTYDEAWDKTRKPLLPQDFDRRFFNAASPGMTAPGYLLGNEHVVIIGASPDGRIEFDLPGVPAPVCVAEVRGKGRIPLHTLLDTIIIDTDARTLMQLWRASLVVRNGPHDLLSVEIWPDAASTEAEREE